MSLIGYEKRIKLLVDVEYEWLYYYLNCIFYLNLICFVLVKNEVFVWYDICNLWILSIYFVKVVFI